MKKRLFAYQVFGMIVLFPAITFLEMNHGVSASSNSTSLEEKITTTEGPSSLLHVKMNDKIINNELTISIESILLKSILN